MAHGLVEGGGGQGVELLEGARVAAERLLQNKAVPARLLTHAARLEGATYSRVEEGRHGHVVDPYSPSLLPRYHWYVLVRIVRRRKHHAALYRPLEGLIIRSAVAQYLFGLEFTK